MFHEVDNASCNAV